MSAHATTLEDAVKLLGPNVVYIPNVNGTKIPAIKGWNSVTLAQSLTAEYQAQLRAAGGTSVLLGKPSGGLVTIDADTDEGFAELLELNPILATTLITRGERGANFWLRMHGDYPDHTPLGTIAGKAWGEFRSTGARTTVTGTHPSRRPYVALNPVPPITISFGAIIWPPSVVWPTPKPAATAVTTASTLSAAELAAYTDLVRREGEPYQRRGKTIRLNEPFFARKFSLEHKVLFEPAERQFYVYKPTDGLWNKQTDDAIRTQISDDLKNYADASDVSEIEVLRDNSRLSGLANILRGKVEKRDAFAHRNGIHVGNGVLELSSGKAELQPFSPDFYSRNQIPYDYEPAAACPEFIEKFLKPALDGDDISLIQRWGGSVLMGGNPAQRLLLVTGTAGGGKGTLVQIIESMIGVENTTELRTQNLGERFEQARFLGKILLCGKDVAGNFLQQESAHYLKALVGHDRLSPEIKGSNATPMMMGNFGVVIVCNSKLLVRLDSDIDAYRRRLLLIEYTRPKTVKRDTGLAARLLKNEGPGILRWLVDGAIQHLHELAMHGDFMLSDRQRQRIDGLLAESDSVREFAANELVKVSGGDITVTELYQHYARYCQKMEWEGLNERGFQNRIAGAVKETHHEIRRNDILRGGKANRGFKNIGVRS